jgi:tetratricopeptide (TPR) repeat protein
MLQVVPEWVRLLVWPAHLRADYSTAEFVASTSFGATEAFGLALLLAAFAVVWIARHRAPVISFGLAWCAVTLFPVSNVLLPTGIFLAERTLFSPSIGFLIAMGGAVALLVGRWRPEWAGRRRVLAVACLALVVAGTVRSALRQRVYRDQVTLNLASVADAPRSARVQQAFAKTLFDQGRNAEAVAAYRRAIKFSPEPWQLRTALAQRLRMMGDDDGALEELRLSLAQKPTQGALAELAAALLAVGKYAEAGRIAEGIIASAGAPPIMVWLKRVADSALAVGAPPGSIKVGILQN